jgi:hypothetical protein
MTEPYLKEIAQDPAELARFCALLAQEQVTSYLEVGAKFGGSFFAAVSALPFGARAVAIDMPGGTGRWKESEASLKAAVTALRAKGYDAQVIWGDSTDPATIQKARALGPFDACLIDANHTLPYVTKDFANYGPLARVVAFHDLAWKRAPDWVGTRIDVPEFWAGVKDQFVKTEEIILCPTGKNNGIGVGWNAERAT